MSKRFTLILSLCLSAIITFSQDDWKLRKDRLGIKVFTKEVKGSDLKAFKGEIILDFPLEDILSIMRDPEHTVNWMPRISKAELLKTKGLEGHIAYFENNAPWPVKHRDGIYEFTFINRTDGSVWLQIDCLPDYLPEKENIIRLRKVDSYWHFIPLAENKVKVVYFAHPDVGGKIPAWLANTSAVSLPFDSLKGLREQLAEIK